MLCATCRARASQALRTTVRSRTNIHARPYARRAKPDRSRPARLQDYQPPPRRARNPHPPPENPDPTKPNTKNTGRLSDIAKSRRRILLLGGALAALVPTYCSFQYTTLVQNAKRYAERDEPVPADTSFVYNWTAEQFDKDVDYAERWYTHISRLRKKMCEMARGHVLESAVGTGRNTTAYPLVRGDIKSVTMVDKSRPMLDVARRKWPEEGNAWYINAIFRVADLASEDPAAAAMVRPPVGSGARYFDTIIQTMGVCSTGDPVQLLRNLGRLCEPEQGRILLIEHGRSTHRWLNELLDMGGPAHAERHGCWWNRDVGQIVRDSGLEIVEEERFDLGTTWWYVLKVPEDRSKIASQRETAGTLEEVKQAIVTRPWWRFW